MNKKLFRNVITLLLVVFTVVAFTSSKKYSIQPLDYSKEANWVDIEKSGLKPVDVFFIIPTVAMTTENSDGFASISEMEEAKLMRVYQASAYEDTCNVYMPYYRQTAMSVAMTMNKDNQAYVDFAYYGKAYADIEAALDYYFENYNNGKPFVLAGHSQGSAMLVNVLTHYLQEHKEYLPRMVAAYLIGFAPSADIFNIKTGLKFATCEDDYNVVVSFTTEGPDAEGKTILTPEKPMVINPLNWRTDNKYAPGVLNKGTGVLSPNKDRMTIIPSTDDAQINMKRKTLICYTRPESEFTVVDSTFATQSFHEKEYSYYFGNIKDNVDVRVKAYLADH